MNLPQIELKILKFWDGKNIFKKSLAQRKKSRFFSFYDGPPFASGPPHYGHILATTIKDTVLRYVTMRGFRTERRVGWDCHGLPVENTIEKELGIKNKREIEKLGIKKFNEACRASVFRCVKAWETTFKRVGRWADYKNSYATMDNEYIESVWWVFKQLFQAGLVYQAYRVAPYCPRCGTPLSNFELNQPGAYQDIEDETVYVKFPIKGERDSFFLVWTTTPWTLSANTALAVGESINYAKVKTGEEKYILAKERLNVLGRPYEIENECLGGALAGLEYDPPYPMKLDKPGYRVAAADFVAVEQGTGIVHIAPAFGEEDMELSQKENLAFVLTVDLEGKVKKAMNIPGEGKHVKEANRDIKDDLKKRKLLFSEQKFVHAYPFCWRCDTALLYYPINSWYVAVSKFKDELVKNNQQIRWSPAHLKDGRFGKWLEGARDWAISRNRFWGAPLPIWLCEKCQEKKVAGSVKELSVKIKDLHRPYIDDVYFVCERCGGKMRRTEEVFDCWFESGAMPYAQWHYPFENKKMVEENFPADFIAEGIDQTRGWFYTLHVLAAALTRQNIGLGEQKPAFKNAVVNGLVLAEDGKKLSKKLRNYPEPETVFDKFGADALRYFLLSSTAMGEDYYFSESRVAEVYRRAISTLWHTLSFWQTYIDKNFKPQKSWRPKNLLDRWITSRLNSLAQEIISAMDNYDLTEGARPLDLFIDDLSNWFVRRARRRFQKPRNAAEKEEAEQALYFTLLNFAKLAAPFIPFLSEEIYLALKTPRMLESVHLCDYPEFQRKLISQSLEDKMAWAREVAALALAERAAAGIKVRQPLASLKIKSLASRMQEQKSPASPSEAERAKIKDDKELLDLIKDEVNVKQIIFDETLKTEINLDKKITKELAEEGIAREIIRQIQDMRRQSGLTRQDKIELNLDAKNKRLNSVFAKWQDLIFKETVSQSPKAGQVFGADLEKIIKLGEDKVKAGIKKVRK